MTGPAPILSVTGERVSEPVKPGTFAALRRSWKDGDRVELELPMPLRLAPVDANHPQVVALMRGPLVLFAVADAQPEFSDADLLRAQLTNNSAGDLIATAVDGKQISMRPFMSIDKESYSTYVKLKA